MFTTMNDIMYDLYKEYCRLKGFPLPTTPLEQWIDENAGFRDKNMKEFAKWFYDEILPRMPEL